MNQNENETREINESISNFLGKHAEGMDSLIKACLSLDVKVKLSDVKNTIITFFLISEAFGMSCAVFMMHISNYCENAKALFSVNIFRTKVTSSTREYNNHFLLNYVRLRILLKNKSILTPENYLTESSRASRKLLTRYMKFELEDPNFIRGYIIMRYMEQYDKKLLSAFQHFLLHVVDAGGNPVFTKANLSSYFGPQLDGQKNEETVQPEPVKFLTDEILRYIPDGASKLASSHNTKLLGECCVRFNSVWAKIAREINSAAFHAK